MSQLWKHIRPAEKVPAVVDAKLSPDGRVLSLEWDDGKKSAVGARTLRQLCPCASCVDEWTHKRTFDTEAVPAQMQVRELRPVGNYALSLTFGDGHQTGIFNWAFLRKVSEEHPASAG